MKSGQSPAPRFSPLALRLERVLVRDLRLTPGESILVALSAGPDSTALVHLLAELRPRFPLRLAAAYVDHGLRPGETPAEWALVQKTCADLGIPAFRAEADARGEAARARLSLEDAARRVRYRALAALQVEAGTRLLALAHTADDQAEAVLLRLFRGGSRRALSGMRAQNGCRIRPLLGLRKAELLDYLQRRGLPFCLDSSNADTSILRNRVRLRLLPLLEAEYDPGVRGALLKCADNLAADEALLETLRDEAWNRLVTPAGTDAKSADHAPPGFRLELAGFLKLAEALRRRVLERLLNETQGAASHEHIMALLRLAREAEPGRELHLKRGLRARKTRDALLFAFPWGRGAVRG